MFARKRKFACVLLLVICCIALVLLASCKRNPTDDPDNPGSQTGYGIDGVYYTVDDGFEYLFTISGNTFMISGLNGDQSGTFTYENGALTLTFRQGDATTASAKLTDGVLELTYNGGVYRMLARTQHTVSFDVDGGSAVDAQKVLNGACAVKPGDPTKAGYAFIGWYTDKAYTTPFAFDATMIHADTTVYARFEEHATGQVEYIASLICEDQAFEPMKTINGVLHNLPTPPAKDGMTFAGWWMSDSQSVSKLTCKYTGQKLTQDTLLFAVYVADGTPAASVSATGVTWNAVGAGIGYRVTIQKGDNTIVDSNVSSTEYKFDFSAQAAGEYVITVTANGKSSTVYYRNKTLDRVSGIRVVSGVLVFNPVSGAQKYTISFVCGTKNHEHGSIDNGTSTNYVFANCAMPADGITFVITATADGYLSSTATYTYFLGLDAVQGIKAENGMITWFPVENATAYIVGISADGEHYTNAYVSSGTSYDISALGKGSYYVTVTPVSAGYYVAPATPVQFTKNALAVPSGITLAGKILRWNAVEGAVSYNINIAGTVYQSSTASLELTDEIFGPNLIDCPISVQAVAADAGENSPYSAAVTISRTKMGEISYRNGYVYWSPVFGASKYVVRVGSESFEVGSDATSAEILFNESGNVEISVCFVDAAGDESAASSVTVEVFAIELDVRGGSKVANVLYKAYGDSIELPETSRDGYDFAGWYTTPNGVAVGKEYTDTVFEGRSDMVLYANWSSKRYTITLVPGDGATVDSTTVEVIYGRINKIPVARSGDKSLIFTGWYTDIGGAGICYFDAMGETTERWNTPRDITLYASFQDLLKYEEIDNGNAYAVSKGDFGIGTLTEITIPDMYNGKYVTTIEASGFNSCSTLVTIRIPNTVTNIVIPSTGINSTGSAFQYCSKLTNIEIYDAGAKAPVYFSVDGVLYKNSENSGVQIVAVPVNKTGIYRIDESATTIPSGAFASSKLSEIIIPHTIASIQNKAITSCSSLTKLTFLPAPEGVEEVALQLADGAINSCSKLTEIVLPGRIAEFTEKTISSCSNLTSLDISGTSASFSAKGEAGRKVLCDAAGTTLVFCPRGMAGDFTIPSGITVIGEGAFSGCSKLTSVTVPGFVTTIEKEAFKSCSKLTSIDLDEEGQPLTIATLAFQSCSGLTQLTLPARLIKLEKNAFAATSKLVKVTVNSVGVKNADGEFALDFATAAFGSTATTPVFYVTDLIIGDNVPAFDITAVFGKKLNTITLSEKNTKYISEEGILYNSVKTRVLFFPTDYKGVYTLPDTITEIADSTFQSKTGLTGIVIGPQVKAIGDAAFMGCSALENVTFLPTATGTEKVPLTIGNQAFESCKSIITIDLPDRLTAIGEFAFRYCGGLTGIVIPEGVTSLGNGAFYSCGKLESVSLPSTLAEITLMKDGKNAFTPDDFSVFYNCSQLSTVTVASGSKNFLTVDNVLYGLKEKTENNNTTYVPDVLLACPIKKAGSSTVTVPAGVTHVASNAFFYNTTVTAIEISDVPEFTAGNRAFYYAKALASVTLPTGLTSLSEEMFAWCQKLQAIEVPYTVKTIENKAFYYCQALSSITFAPTPANVAPVELVITDAAATSGSYGTTGTGAAFGSCPKLKTIDFPERMTILGSYAFGGYADSSSYVPGLVSVSLPSTLKRIGERAFYNAANLTTVTFAPGIVLEDGSSSVPAIGSYAFGRCTSLKTIDLPATVLKNDKEKTITYSIGTYAFYMSKLESITIPNTVVSIGNYAFAQISTLKDFAFAEGTDGATLKLGTNLLSGAGIPAITLPAGIVTIPASTFLNCKSLTSITVPSTVTTIGASAFSGCVNLAEVNFATYTGKDGKEYSNVNNIGANAFEKTAFSTFTFPTLENASKYITLGANMFKLNSNLETITLSRSVNKLDNVLTGCYNIKNFVLTENNKFSTEPGTPVLFNAAKTEYVFIFGILTGDYVIPTGITKIGANLFEGQYGITSLTIPYTVKTIGNYAFRGCRNLESVVFEHSAEHPSQITSYGTYMFQNCYALSSVTLPGNMKSLPNYMFSYCTSLETITIPETVTTIGTNVFQYSGLTQITIPCKVTSIGNYAFGGATTGGSLTSVTFARNANGTTALTSIGNYAFQYQVFETVEIPKSVKTLGSNAFSYNPNLTSFTFEAGTQFSSTNSQIVQNCTALKTFTIPAGVKTLGSGFFTGCSALSEVIFENGSLLTTIKSSAFKGTAITSIEIPADVTTLESNAFQDCVKLTSVTFGKNSKLNYVGAYCFRNTAIESIELPAGVTVLGISATSATISSSAYQFADCFNLKSVTFKGELTKLGGYVFYNCQALTSITLPATLNQIGNNSFKDCTNLKSVTLRSAGELTIGADAFENSGLTSIMIPKGTIAINNYAFRNCASLRDVAFELGTEPLTIGTYAFQGTAIASVTIPGRTVSVSTGAFKDCAALKNVTFENGDEDLSFGTSVFENCTALTSVVLPDNLDTLSNKTFYGDRALTSVYLGKVTEIGSSVFVDCKALQTITLPEKLFTIGSDSFLGTGLTKLTIPASLEEIGDNAFGCCYNLMNFTVAADNKVFEAYNITANEQALVKKGDIATIIAMPGTVTGTLTLPAGYQIGAYALNGISGLTEVILPEGITEIPRYAFAYAKLSSVKIPSSVTKIDVGAFWSSDITSVEIPAGVTTIGNSAFKDCENLTTVTFAEGSQLQNLGTQVFRNSAIESIVLPEKVTMLGDTVDVSSYMFQDCVNLKSVTFLGNLLSLNGYAFKGCTSLTSFVIPASVQYIGSYVFAESGLVTIEIPAGLPSLNVSTSTVNGSSSYTFRDCAFLETVILHEGLEYINYGAFMGCTALKAIHIPSTVVEVGTKAFSGCTALTTVTFAEGCEAKLGNNTFEFSGLVSIELPAGVNSLGTNVFDGCADLENATFLGNITQLPQYTFRNCTSLKSFTIPESVTTIGANAFTGAGLTSMVIPATATSLNSSIFKDCVNLETVVFEEGCTTVSGSMFSGCTALRSVELASATTTISGSAFENCTALTELKVPAYVSTISGSAFAGWTSKQTIRFSVTQAASNAFTSGWDKGCDAKIIWADSQS